MQLLDTLNPQIKVSDVDFPDLFLGNFHMVVLSEPDPETWIARLEEEDEFYQLLQFHSDLIVEELYGEFEIPEGGLELADDVQGTLLVAVGEGVEIPLYYHHAISYAHALFRSDTFEFERLNYFLRGVATEHPNWRVAVIGGVYEDEVVRVANTVQEAGFDTTIVTRYCISSNALVDMDELFASMTEEEHRRIIRERWMAIDKEKDLNRDNDN